MATYKQIEDALKVVARLNSRVCKLEKSGGGYTYLVDNYDALLVEATSPQANEFAYIKNSQGTRWDPWNVLGGTYYPSGTWFYTGSEWINDKSKIAEQLQINIDELISLDTTIQNHINDLANPHQTPIGGGTVYSDFLTEATVLYYYRSYITNYTQANWVVERFLASDLNTVLVADINNNGAYNNQAAAWANRATLTYA